MKLVGRRRRRRRRRRAAKKDAGPLAAVSHTHTVDRAHQRPQKQGRNNKKIMFMDSSVYPGYLIAAWM